MLTLTALRNARRGRGPSEAQQAAPQPGWASRHGSLGRSLALANTKGFMPSCMPWLYLWATQPSIGLCRNPSGLNVFIEMHGDKRFHSKSFHPHFLLLSASPVRSELGMLSCVFRASSSSTASLFLFCSNLLVFRLPQRGGRAPQVSVKH